MKKNFLRRCGLFLVIAVLGWMVFFLQDWELVLEGLYLAVLDIINKGSMPEFLLDSLIFLIDEEGGVLEEICQLRHITVLNTTYNVLVKAPSLRL